VKKLDELMQRVASEQDALRAREALPERVARRFHRFTPKRQRRAGMWALVAAAVGLVALLIGVYVTRDRSALAVSVGGASGSPLLGAWLGAPDKSSLPLDFSDGSRFELAPQSRARVVELSRKGARVELASGSLNVHVVPGGGANWQIDAGPFGVRITGTRFVVGYVPDGEAFELSVSEGQVELSGCMFGSGRRVATGQRVRASCKKRTLDVSYSDGVGAGTGTATSDSPPSAEATGASGTVAALPAEPAAASSVGASAGTARPSPARSGPDWLALARAGKYADAYAAVERDGFDAVSQRSSADALTLLAEVARHARAERRAREALLTLRRRFAGSNDAALAAFTLGRLEFDERHAYAAAAAWFRTYLQERPRGAMAREALGRLIEASHRAQDAASARASAARYLREYPTGPHAELASRLVGSP
jgi:transmembrane sensor